MLQRSGGRSPRTTVLAWALCAVGVAESAAAIGLSIAVGWSVDDAVDSYVVTNTAMGLAFPVCGVLLAWQRPRNPIGWLFLAAGVGHATTALFAPLTAAGISAGWSTGTLRTVQTLGTAAWPWSIGLCVPLALLLFPTGRPAGRGWRWVCVAAGVSGALFVTELATNPTSLPVAGVTAPLAWTAVDSFDALAPLWTAAAILNAGIYMAALVSLVLRYRRGDDVVRRQLLWLVLALLAVVAVVTVWGVFGLGPVLLLLVIPLIPISITAAILRHRLLDIRLVVSRVLVYLVLSVAAVGVYVGLVLLIDRLFRPQGTLGGAAVATVVVAVLFNPVRVQLQRLADRAIYGDRHDPIRALSRLGTRLAAGGGALDGALDAIRESLRLPFAALRLAGREVAASGTADGSLETVRLLDPAAADAELVVGVRAGQRRLGAEDRRVLDVLAAPLAVALRATVLSRELQASRERIVAAREEERRRLRRDLHDGLGPTLSGVAFGTDAARNIIATEPERAAELLARLREQTGGAIAEIRRLVEGLRPPVLDELGLVAALRQHAEQLVHRADGHPIQVSVDARDDLPPLPAAVEVAAYRIAVEALTNAARHSSAEHAVVRLHLDKGLHVEITDDGGSSGVAGNGSAGNGAWQPGVGLNSIAERCAEVGGRCEAGPGSGGGGRVAAVLPVGTP